MSAHNGDRSRYHRERKQKIARRMKHRELLKQTLLQLKKTGAGSKSQGAS
jgi:hypothetical protein